LKVIFCFLLKIIEKIKLFKVKVKVKVKVKLKQPHYRLGEALRVPGC
jgi:hypothetical protein